MTQNFEYSEGLRDGGGVDSSITRASGIMGIDGEAEVMGDSITRVSDRGWMEGGLEVAERRRSGSIVRNRITTWILTNSLNLTTFYRD
jgi:hypothetical protein